HVFKPDLVHLRAIVHQENSRSATTSLNLRLHSCQMAAQRSRESALAAVKSAFADLTAPVTKHKGLLSGPWARKATRPATREVGVQIAAEPVPSSKKTNASHSEASASMRTDTAAVSNIETWLSANLRKLEEFVDRELEFLVESERIREGQIARE